MLETIIQTIGKARGAVAALFSDLPAGPGQGVFSIARKELSAYFSSPAAFIFIGVFLAALLFIFFWVDRFFARNIADVRPLFEWMPILLIFLVSAMTMRMWSEERRAGTLEFLLTAPVPTLDLVIGKFLACLALVGITLALTLPLAHNSCDPRARSIGARWRAAISRPWRSPRPISPSGFSSARAPTTRS